MKKVAVSTIKSFLKENKQDGTFTNTFQVGESTFDVSFRTDLTVVEKTAFINRVLSGCFDADGNYHPEYVTPMFRATVLQMCTNVPPLTMKRDADENGSPALDLDGMNALYEAMRLGSLSNSQFWNMIDEMFRVCSQAIEWKKSSVLSASRVDTAVKRLVDTLAAKVDAVDTETLMQYAGKLSKATDGMEEGELADKVIELSKYRDETNV